MVRKIHDSSFKIPKNISCSQYPKNLKKLNKNNFRIRIANWELEKIMENLLIWI